MKKPISPVDFIRRVIKKSELGKPFKLMPFQEEILNLAFAFDEDGRLPYDTVIYSCPKKSGKTTLNSALTLWWALTQEAPNECLVVANDLEQARARAFASCEGIIEHNAELRAECEVQQKNIFCNNGTRSRLSHRTIKGRVVQTTGGAATKKFGRSPARTGGGCLKS